jgi:hypothetical protein
MVAATELRAHSVGDFQVGYMAHARCHWPVAVRVARCTVILIKQPAD